MPWRIDDAGFRRWQAGTTGYPLVDAGMRELAATGFVHNRIRMVTASFLTRHMLLDWRLSERHFVAELLDAQLAQNDGDWQWVAGTGADAQEDPRAPDADADRATLVVPGLSAAGRRAGPGTRPRAGGARIRAGGARADAPRAVVYERDMRGARVVLTLLLAAGCGFGNRKVAVESGVTFAAHIEHEGIVFDRYPGGGHAIAKPRSGFRLPGSPAFVLERDGTRAAAFWLPAPSTVEVRATDESSAMLIGEVIPDWDDDAIRLTLRRGDAAPLHTETFAREWGGATAALSRSTRSNLDLRGSYRARLRDASGTDVGWLRVRVGPFLDAPRIYDGVLPGDVVPEVTVATVLALSSELDWIETHTLDVNRGTSDGPRGLSTPMGR